MKKIVVYFLVVVLSVVIFLFGINYQKVRQPHTYYKVYLDSELIGMIESKDELKKYINKQADLIRDNIREYNLKISAIDTYNSYSKNIKDGSNLDKANTILKNKDTYKLSEIDIENLNYYINEGLYNYSDIEQENMKNYVTENDIFTKVNDIDTPNGIEIKKVYTYNSDVETIQEIYKRIVGKKSFTIAGYTFTIKSADENSDDITVYTLDKETFNDAIEDLITIFVDSDEYELYKKNEQEDISDTGSVIENIYVDEDITYKATNISTSEKIYTNSKELSEYLLYGNNNEAKKVRVGTGDSIESVALNNQISVEEFLISNPQYNSRDNLLVPNSEVTILKVDPKIQIVVETYEVVDKETNFSTIEQYDESLSQGSVIVTQEGENGIERVTQNVKSINGEIVYMDPVDKETIKSSVPKIVSIGTKYIPNVGSVTSWGWPTDPGYTLSSYFGYRLQVFGEGNFHSGIDIAGTGYGSNVYAANNGVIEEMKILKDSNGNYTNYGIYILINHNNGFYSLYGHLSRFASNLSVGSTVSRGDIIGYIGMTGWTTGPHLHFEIRTCARYSCITNPLNYY